MTVVVQVLGHEQGVALVEGLSDCAPVGALVLFSNGSIGCATGAVLLKFSVWAPSTCQCRRIATMLRIHSTYIKRP